MEEDDNQHVPAFVSDRLRRGSAVPDKKFDEVYPFRWRRRSSRFWTPVPVAMRAAAWFAEKGHKRVLDIGSGVGKMCIVGALSTDVEFTGVEQRESLVDAARSAAKALDVERRVSFIHASIESVDASAFEAFYLYNPFGENLYTEEEWLDGTVELSEERFVRDAKHVEALLEAAPLGARAIAYHGFGGRFPRSFSPERALRIGSDALRMWVKNPVPEAPFSASSRPLSRG